jgi:translocation and assembly module TamA
MARLSPLYVAIALLVFLLLNSAPLFAADPVEVEVMGVEGAALKNVQLALTLPYGLVRDGKVDELWLNRFARQSEEKARVALEPFGYYHARVSTTVKPKGDGRFLLLVAVVPGEPVRITSVDIELKGAGAGEAGLRQLVKNFQLRQGSILLQPEYEREKGALKSRAVGQGYLDADFTRHEIRIAPGELTAAIALTLDTGELYYFDDVRIEGATDYPREFLKRYLAFKKGELFSFSKIGETQLNYSNSERFKSVVINPEKELAKDHMVPVLIKLASAPRRTVRPGLGYGTDTGARFSVHYRELNLFHMGQDMDLMLYLAERLQGFAALYSIPNPRDLRGTTTVQLNLQKEDITTYTSRLAALEVAYNRGLGRGEVATPYIRLQQENFDIGNEKSSSRLIMPGFRFSKEHFDNLIRPVQGFRYALELRGAHPFLGSDVGFVQFIADGNTIIPLPGRLSLQFRSRVGVSQLSDPLDDIPPTIRFFAGGDQSVRGYSYRSLGPKNAQGEVIGGKNLLTGTVELERALFEKWGISVFHDAGNAFNDFNNLHLYQGAGVGLHYYTPVGGLNVSLAKRLGVSKEIFYVHFSVGFQL